ncbi:MAG TPA: NfeD family protein, partial [bacterium]|nr:NfeD family protein [bacterium]
RVSSTGVYLLLGADAVALGPESRIGPSHPIRLAPGPGGGLDLRSILSPVGGSTVVSGQTSPMAESLAFAERLGQQRGNGGIADAVRSAIEGRTLLGRDLQGRAGVQIVETAGFRPVGVVRGFDQTSIGRASPPRVLSLATPAIVALAPAWYVQIGQVVANPWVVLFFLLLGIYGLVSELLHPGTVLPALLGVTALGLAGWGLWSLPVAPWGVVLVIFGALFILAEAKVGGPGFFGIPGAIMFLWGALTFIPAQYGDLRIPVYAVGLIGVLVLGLGFMAIRYIRHALQSGPAIGGIEGLVGEVGEARSPLAPEGTIFVHGEYWSARTRDLAPLPEGAAVRVLAKEGPLLVVEPVPPPP